MLLVAGKGHETGQIVGDQTLPFSDHEAVAAALAGEGGMSAAALDRRGDGAARWARRAQGALPPSVPGLSIDTRTLQPGEAFFAHQGRCRDGHDFVEAALKAGGGLAVVAADKRGSVPEGRAAAGRARRARRPDRALARAARARSSAKFIGVTGSVGKTGTKEALRLALSSDGETHASAASYNNHWGVPLSLARCPQSARYAVFEIGMNHAGEIAPLTKLVRPHVAIITTSSRCIWNFSARSRPSPTPRRRSSRARAGRRRGPQPRQPAFRAACRTRPKAAGVGRIVSFGEHAKADARLLKFALQADSSTVAGAHPRRRRRPTSSARPAAMSC